MRLGLSVNTVSEGDAAAAVIIVRNGGERAVSSFTWWTSGGTATAGLDYADFGTVVDQFAAGQQNRMIRIPIVGDRRSRGPRPSTSISRRAKARLVSSERAETEVVINDDD